MVNTFQKEVKKKSDSILKKKKNYKKISKI